MSARTFYYSLCSSQQYGEDLNIRKLWTNFLPESVIDGLNTSSLNTSDLISGIYVFEIELNGKTTREKFVISK